jgi:tRNA-splicing ligase RtcB (3'-phosphate/5'-hydroxy nucleic acid ligase)
MKLLYIVKVQHQQVKGEATSINSASHGAGRKMSRSKAIANITHDYLRKELQEHGVTLLGGGLDEAPQAYKDINEVMKCQTALVDVLGKFLPKIVQMDGADVQKMKHRYRKEKAVKVDKDIIVGE